MPLTLLMTLTAESAVRDAGSRVGDEQSRQQQFRQVDGRRRSGDRASRGGEQRTQRLQLRRGRRQLRHSRSMQLPLRHRAARPTQPGEAHGRRPLATPNESTATVTFAAVAV